MEHVKKMVVVPQELIDRLNSNNVMTQPRQQSSAGGLDTEMHRILNDKHLDDVEKWKQYQQVLRRFLHLTSQQRGPNHSGLDIWVLSSGVSNVSFLQHCFHLSTCELCTFVGL